MADTQSQPQLSGENAPGSIREAQEALLGIMEPGEVKPQEEEAAPTEEEESTEEIQDESLEEDDQELKASEYDEEGSEDQTDDEEIEEPDSNEPDLYAVTVDGEEHEVTFDELLKGYSRQSDYTKKTQQLSSERKQLEDLQLRYNSELSQIQAERKQYVDSLKQMSSDASGPLDKFANINWQSLRDSDPIEYVTKREEFRESQEKVQAIKMEQQQAQQKQAEDSKNMRLKVLQEEHAKLSEVLPEWKDPSAQKQLASKIRNYATSQGFSEEEVASLIDHRSLLVLLKASKYDALEKSNVKAKKLKNKPRVIRPGSPSSKSSSKGKRTAQMKRLQQSGHVKDATSLFEDFVDL